MPSPSAASPEYHCVAFHLHKPLGPPEYAISVWVRRRARCPHWDCSMSLFQRAYSGAVPRCQPAPSNYIWIGDDILDRALRRFLNPQCPRRHGSSVPGPLEAQRRANKRRMVGLASVGTTGGNVDPGFLWGLLGRRDPQKWQWQAPNPAEAPKVSSTEGTDLSKSTFVDPHC